MEQESMLPVRKLNIQSVNHLADILKIPPEKLRELSADPNLGYRPYHHHKPLRPFQKKARSAPRQIDHPIEDLSWAQKRINKRLLSLICFPDHIFGGIRHRSVLDNAEHHHNAALLVTIDVRQCFPSITNVHIYSVWKELLGCAPPVASLLTQLTTFERHLPQGAATSPLLANLFIWMIDEPIRAASNVLGVAYSTWIDDLAFSGARARELIEVAISTLAAHGLKVSRKKIKIMGPNEAKLITGIRLGVRGTRAPREKLSRIRSGIHYFALGAISDRDAERYLKGLVAQLRFLHQLCQKDAISYAAKLRDVTRGRFLSVSDQKFLTAAAPVRDLHKKRRVFRAPLQCSR